MNNPAKVAEWKSDYYDEWGDQGNLQLRYPYWQPIAAINQNRIYAFDIVAAFYDPQGQCYYAARTSGCSCPSPWDEAQTEVKGPMGSRRECLQAFRQLSEKGDEYTDDAYPASQAIDATQAILNHTPGAAAVTTLADLTPAERAECVGMWVFDQELGLLIYAGVDKTNAHMFMQPAEPDYRWDERLLQATPRFDLPRAWQPDGEPIKGNWKWAFTDELDNPLPGPNRRYWDGDWEDYES